MQTSARLNVIISILRVFDAALKHTLRIHSVPETVGSIFYDKPSAEVYEIIIFNYTSLPEQYLSSSREIVSDRPVSLTTRRPLNSVMPRLERASRDLRISRVSIYVRGAGITGAAY